LHVQKKTDLVVTSAAATTAVVTVVATVAVHSVSVAGSLLPNLLKNTSPYRRGIFIYE
jgi:hypothetical protein